MSSSADELLPGRPRPFNTAIVGGGKGCESFIRMVEEDRLGRFRLRICGIVKRYNGAITVESEPGQGATFRVILPVSE